MARLSDAANLTDELERRVRRLREEIAQGESDLGQLVVLADDVAAYADSLAARFAAIDRQIVGLAEVKPGSSPGEKPPSQRRKTKRQSGRGGQRRRSSTLRRTEEPTVTELLEQAKEAAIPGRSSMSKDELAEAVEAQEQQTKDELLEQAQALGIRGRSEMSKQELLEAVRAEAAVSRDELLDRAREAEIPGRSEMSKEELREALQPGR